MAESRFIPPLTESNVTYALFAWVDLWFIGTSVIYEVFRCLHDPLLANLCFRVKIQKWASIKSAAGSIKTRVFWSSADFSNVTPWSVKLGIMLRSIQRRMRDIFGFYDFWPNSHVLLSLSITFLVIYDNFIFNYIIWVNYNHCLIILTFYLFPDMKMF